MPVDRFYVDAPLTKDKQIILTGGELQHLQKVTRHTVGDVIEVINGKDQIAHARVDKFDKKGALLTVIESKTFPHLEPSLILVQAIPRLNRLETILEKCIELNVSEIWLFPSFHTEKADFSPNQLERLKFISVSALKQCGRLDLPPIVFKESLEDILPLQGSCFFGDLDEKAPTLLEGIKKATLKPIYIFIGPESGFHEKEIAVLKRSGVQGVSLLKTTLRVDTAAIASVAIAAHLGI